MESTKETKMKAMQPMTGTVHYARTRRSPRDPEFVQYLPACTWSTGNTRISLRPVSDETPVTCRRCSEK